MCTQLSPSQEFESLDRGKERDRKMERLKGRLLLVKDKVCPWLIHFLFSSSLYFFPYIVALFNLFSSYLCQTWLPQRLSNQCFQLCGELKLDCYSFQIIFAYLNLIYNSGIQDLFSVKGFLGINSHLEKGLFFGMMLCRNIKFYTSEIKLTELYIDLP